MKKQSIIFLAIGILVFTACKKDSETNPSTSSTSTTVGTEKKSTGDTTCQGNGQPKGMPPSPEEIMAKLDTNKDGKISREEAQGPLANDFDKIDSNKDNYITLDELKNMCPPKQNMCPPKQTPTTNN
jgi:hypothetical protein